MYTIFSEQLSFGEIKWCHHSDMQNVVILSDNDPSTGTLIPSSYVHVTCTEEYNSGQCSSFIKCSCKMYNIMQSTVISQLSEESQGENLILDHKSITCMHCRFYKDNLHNFRHKLNNICETTKLSTKLNSSIPHINNPVVSLGIQSQHGTSKLSVASEQDYSIVHINFTSIGTCFANRKNGECCAS